MKVFNYSLYKALPHSDSNVPMRTIAQFSMSICDHCLINTLTVISAERSEKFMLYMVNGLKECLIIILRVFKSLKLVG